MDSSKIFYLSRADVEQLALDIPAIVGILEAAFREKGEGRVEIPPKPGIHPQLDSFIHAMPAYIPRLKSAGMKWVSGFPQNPARGLPYISGLIILNDTETGIPYAVMDATWITAYRTGAVSALSAKFLARPKSETLGILACGVQGRTHLLAMRSFFPIKRVYAYDVSPEAQSLYIKEMSEQTGLEVVGAGNPMQAVSESDIVVTSGPLLRNPKPTIGKNWLRPGAFASAVDFDSYWEPDALAQMDKLATDDLPQFRYYKCVGYFERMTEPYADLGELVVGKKRGRENDSERTMAMNLGLAIDDLAVATEIYGRARERSIGTWLPL
jgi:ornithine cyclodeaminase/alanine dehydrogenase-like protein (mu-crystallin family)